MRESDDGRRTVPPWSDASTAFSVGDTVYSGVASCGKVVSVDIFDNDTATISAEWEDDRYGPITYPADATYLRKAFPWES